MEMKKSSAQSGEKNIISTAKENNNICEAQLENVGRVSKKGERGSVREEEKSEQKN